MVEANHMCACVRGVRHDSTMMTSKMSGAFLADGNARSEFYKFVEKLAKNK
jgi:GTP cyclohydrolase I